MTRRLLPAALVVAGASMAGIALGPHAAVAGPVAAGVHDTPLPLGPATLPETRTTRAIDQGVTYTHITRGAANGSLRWVVEVSMPSDSTSPDPDAPARAVQNLSAAKAAQTALSGKGIATDLTPVAQPRTADLPGGVIGYRLRLTTTYSSKADADTAVARVKAAGYGSRSWYQGWDGADRSCGPWSVDVLTIDPKAFRGRLGATYGPDIERRETVTRLAGMTNAVAAINAGFFVMDPAAGAEGDPAGVGVYDGAFESEPVRGRPAVTFDERARGFRVVRPTWKGTASANGTTVGLDGINRVPGTIRNCGASDATPTTLPLHDYTCTAPNETVLMTPEFGAKTPSGPGTEAILDRRGVVTAVNPARGTALRSGEHSLQGIGTDAPIVGRLHVGDRVTVRNALTANGESLLRRGRFVVNGAPQLLKSGSEYITQKTDGFAPANNPSFTYGWVLQRNPRTFAGTDAQGRIMLVAADGRQPGRLGLSIPESAAVAKALGMREAMNLDGGGSTAMNVDGSLVTHPSDATGERPVGDAIVVR